MNVCIAEHCQGTFQLSFALQMLQVMFDGEKEKNERAHVVSEMDKDISAGLVCRQAVSIEATLQRDQVKVVSRALRIEMT